MEYCIRLVDVLQKLGMTFASLPPHVGPLLKVFLADQKRSVLVADDASAMTQLLLASEVEVAHF
jgi:hypothetical protein